MKFVNIFLLVWVSVANVACQSLSRGIPGLSAQLQFVVNEHVVFEYAVPVDGMPCFENAALNNKEIADKSEGHYRCTNFPAPERELPYNFTAVHQYDHAGRESAAATTRFASSEACWEAVAVLQENKRRLVEDNCGPKPTPSRAFGDKLA